MRRTIGCNGGRELTFFAVVSRSRGPAEPSRYTGLALIGIKL